MLSINVTPASQYCRNNLNLLSAAVTFELSGAYYLTAPDVAFSGGGGSGATAHAVVVNGVVTSIVLDNPGSSYETAPTITIGGVDNGGGSGATATSAVNVGGEVTGVTVTNGGGLNLIFTDNTAYDTANSEERAAVNITVFDKFGGKVEAQITGADVDDAITVSLGSLNTGDSIDGIVTVVSNLGNRKDGSAYDMVTKGTGSFTMKK